MSEEIERFRKERDELSARCDRLCKYIDCLVGFKAAMDCNDVGSTDYTDAYYALMNEIDSAPDSRGNKYDN